jgi:hypothetical protein
VERVIVHYDGAARETLTDAFGGGLQFSVRARPLKGLAGR